MVIPLICLSDVVQLLPTWRQALLRSMGSRGAAAFTEVVGRRLAPYYVEEEHQGVILLGAEGLSLGHSPAILDSSLFTPSLTICVDALVATNIMDDFSDDKPFALDWLGVTINAVEVRLTGGEAVRSIGTLLSNNHTVASIQFDSSFFRVTTIASDCITQCHNLVSIEGIHHMEGLQRIGDRFADRCLSLTSLDLSPLTSLTHIGNHFVRKCTKLKKLQLPGGGHDVPNGSLLVLGDGFAFHCTSLLKLSLIPLCNVASIPNNFLVGCTSLTSLDFTPMARVLRSIGSGFLMECRGLHSLDVSPLATLHITVLPDRFLSSCSQLTDIDYTPLGRTITEIGAGFMAECVRLREVDLSTMVGLTKIGGRFLAGCAELVHITFPLKSTSQDDVGGSKGGGSWALSNMDTIPDGFLYGCNRLTSISLTPFSGVTSIGSDFLSQCSRLEYVDLFPLHAVERIGARFMSKCITLKHIDVTPLASVKRVDEYFLAYCTSLLPPLTLAPMAATAVFIPQGLLEDCPDRLHIIQTLQLGQEPPTVPYWQRRY